MLNEKKRSQEYERREQFKQILISHMFYLYEGKGDLKKMYVFEQYTSTFLSTHNISFYAPMLCFGINASLSWKTYVRLHFPQYCLSKWEAIKTPAPHSGAGHSRLKRLILPLSSTL